MKGPRLAASALAAGALLAACGAGPSAEDETACKLFAAANNDVTTAVNLWVAEGEPNGGSDLVRYHLAQLSSRVTDASARATGDLAVVMGDAARLAAAATSGPDGLNQDANVAYELVKSDVYDACEALGVKLEIVEMN